jgi:hypothetical protein
MLCCINWHKNARIVMADLMTDVKAVLYSTPLRWNTLAQTFPQDLLRRQPKSGEWSALECLQHLIDLDRMLFPCADQGHLCR